MKASETGLLKFIKKAEQFIIPIYQRNYSWNEEQCRQLWDDIIRTGSNEAVRGHFIGSIMYIEDGLSSISSQSASLVIDGQQRLTTIALLLAALRDNLKETEADKFEPLDGFSTRKISSYYLRNPEEEGLKSYKLLLSETDRDSLLELMEGPAATAQSEAIINNFKFFKEKIAAVADKKIICLGLEKLNIVDIALDRDHDNPQLIFESMNSTGLELSQADLIRNYLLMDLPPREQERLYAHYWRPMELDFGQQAYQSEFDPFIRHYLSFKLGFIPRLDCLYETFKSFYRQRIGEKASKEGIIADLRKYAGHYCRMALGKEPDPDLALAFNDLVELKASVAYPMLLEWYDDYHNEKWSKEDFLEALRATESYVWRRAVCGLATNSLNKTFLVFNKNINKDAYLESVLAAYLLLPAYRRFPEDADFKEQTQLRNLYILRPKYWARRLENHGHKEPLAVGSLTVEHIMPQNKNVSPAWRKELGPDWERVHEEWLHRLGNLTLTGYNSEYSDRPFAEKRDMEGGFKNSHIRLNTDLGNAQVWNEDAMRQRGEKLAQAALAVWPKPSLDPAILAAYAGKKQSEATNYTRADHPNLELLNIKPLFEALRREILALSPVVSEEYLKLYVAYKADTNFVDIIPRQSYLKLSLNMDYSELHDPSGIAIDVSGKKTWTNGDVEVEFKSIDQLPAVMDLIRQALETQIGG